MIFGLVMVGAIYIVIVSLNYWVCEFPILPLFQLLYLTCGSCHDSVFVVSCWVTWKYQSSSASIIQWFSFCLPGKCTLHL